MIDTFPSIYYESKKDDCERDNRTYDKEACISLQKRAATDITASRYEMPPDTDHRPVFFAQVLEVVEHISDVAMAVITAQVMHST